VVTDPQTDTQTHKQTNKQTGLITIHCTAKLSAQRKMNVDIYGVCRYTSQTA